MKRTVFAIVVPLLVVMLGALAFADMVASGFQGEGCRFAPDAERRWRAGGEWLVIQAMFGVAFGLVLAGLVSAMRKRQKSQGRSSRLTTVCILLALTVMVAWTLQGLFYVLTCGSAAGSGAVLTMLLLPLRLLTSVAAITLLICVAAAYVAGLQSGGETTGVGE